MIGARELTMHLVWILFLAVVGTLAALITGLAAAGLFLPREHRAARSLRLARTTPEQVWAVISEHGRDPEWRSDVKATTRLEDHHGHAVWQDTFRNGQAMSYETLEAEPGRRLVRRILESGGPYGGTWTYELEAEGAGARLVLTEEGWISNPVFRTLARFAFGHHRTLEGYLRDLARKLGESSGPEPA